MTVKVMIIDESDLFRLGVKKHLTDAGMEVIGEAGDGMSAQRMIRQKTPDVVLLNADLPDGMSLSVCDFITTHFPQTCILFLLNHPDMPMLSRLMRTTSKGFLTKNSVCPLKDAILLVKNGRTYLQPDLGLEFIRFQTCHLPSAAASLTDREYQVLVMTLRGKTYEEIAVLMHLSSRTVFNLKSKGMKKLGVQTLEELRIVVG